MEGGGGVTEQVHQDPIETRKETGPSGGQWFFGVIIVHKCLLNGEVRWQLVLVQLHVCGHQLEGGEVKATDGAVVHQGPGVCLQMADHGGAASEEAMTHFALVGFLPGVDAEVVSELP